MTHLIPTMLRNSYKNWSVTCSSKKGGWYSQIQLYIKSAWSTAGNPFYSNFPELNIPLLPPDTKSKSPCMGSLLFRWIMKAYKILVVQYMEVANKQNCQSSNPYCSLSQTTWSSLLLRPWKGSQTLKNSAICWTSVIQKSSKVEITLVLSPYFLNLCFRWKN